MVTGALRATEILVVMLAGLVTYLAYESWRGTPLNSSYFGPMLLGTATLSLCLTWFRAYEEDAVFSSPIMLDRLIPAVATAVALTLCVAFVLKATHTYSRIWAVSWIGASVVSLFACRAVSSLWIQRLASEGRFASRTVIIGAGEQGRRLATAIDARRDSRTRVVGVVDDRTDRVARNVGSYPVLGGTARLMEMIRSNQIDQVIVALPWSAERRILGLVESIATTPVHIRLAPDLVGFELGGASFTPIAGIQMLRVFDRPISGWSYALKAAEDKVLAFAALLFLSPVMLLIAIAVRLDSPGPILFRQQRYGFNNGQFEVWKFRTMKVAAEADVGAVQATRDDRRVTRLGRFLRRSSLDELPQLFNVLFGEMSMVGPRPHPIGMTSPEGRRFEEVVHHYAARHRVKPGITGWAQVNGWRGRTDTLEKIQKRVEHDLFYIDNWSIWLDLRIIAMTAIRIWLDKNAY